MTTSFDRAFNELAYDEFNSETDNHLTILGVASKTWDLKVGQAEASGTYSITPVPEPSSLFLLMPIAALFGRHWRHQRYRV